MVSVLPDTVQMVLALLVENVNAVKPLLAVALKVMGDAPNVTGEDGVKVTVCAVNVQALVVNVASRPLVVLTLLTPLTRKW